MLKIFTPENRNDILKELLECGFDLLKQGGLAAVNIDVITEMCFIAKGTFYNFFKSKSDYMYQMALYERNRAKETLLSSWTQPPEPTNPIPKPMAIPFLSRTAPSPPSTPSAVNHPTTFAKPIPNQS